MKSQLRKIDTFSEKPQKNSQMFQTLPSLNGLRAYEAVGRLECFSAAAEELMVTHYAVSRLVRALEKQLDIVLLERGRRLQATDFFADYSLLSN